MESGLFTGVKVDEVASKQPEIAKAQFYQTLADSIKARLLSDTEQQLCNAVKVHMRCPRVWGN